MIYIGIDIQKRISTAVAIDENEKIVAQHVDFESTEEGFEAVLAGYDQDDCRIVIENLTTAHRVYNHLSRLGYMVLVLHTGNGCVTEISKSKRKTDLEDAMKLAVICKDIFTGRRKYRLTHIPDKEDMEAKRLCRAAAELSRRVSVCSMRIQSVMDSIGLRLPDGYKGFTSKRALRHIRGLGYVSLALLADEAEFLQGQVDAALEGLAALYRPVAGQPEPRACGHEGRPVPGGLPPACPDTGPEGREGLLFSRDSDAVARLMRIKGISLLTAASIVSSIDGIERFHTAEELVSHFGLDLKVHSSGGKELNRHISKQGDPMVRMLLANVVASHPRYYPDSDLARFFQRMADRMPYWKAVTAAMRKLVCIIWAMLTKGEDYRCNASAGRAGNRILGSMGEARGMKTMHHAFVRIRADVPGRGITLTGRFVR